VNRLNERLIVGVDGLGGDVVTPEGRHYSCRVSGGGSVVLVDEAAESVAATDLADGRCRS
jgi:hypothetical protein